MQKVVLLSLAAAGGQQQGGGGTGGTGGTTTDSFIYAVSLKDRLNLYAVAMINKEITY